MSPAGTGLLLGSLCGGGCWLLARALPVRRAPALEDRVGPYLGARGGGPGDRLRTALLAAGARAGVALGSTEVVRRRLAVLDPDRDPAQHRAEQVLWAFAGVALAALAGAALAARGQVHPVGVLALLLAGGLGGALLRDRVLADAVRRRRAEVLEDLPAVAELLALSVGAGENVAAALERVAAGGGPLCAQLRRALGDVRTGTPLLEALAALADRLGVGALDRFVDGLAVAVEAGSPLAEVLRAQAGDVREAQRRRLLEEGGRREVQMLVPVVFGVLPVTVVFAVLPGLAQLQLG